MSRGAATAPGLLVVGHGSRREQANDTLRSVAALVAERGDWHAVEVGFLEIARPSIGEAYGLLVAAGCDRIVVHPYFLYPGAHTFTDIPAELRAAEAAHPGVPWVMTEPLGVHEKLVDVVLDRVREALAEPP